MKWRESTHINVIKNCNSQVREYYGLYSTCCMSQSVLQTYVFKINWVWVVVTCDCNIQRFSDKYASSERTHLVKFSSSELTQRVRILSSEVTQKQKRIYTWLGGKGLNIQRLHKISARNKTELYTNEYWSVVTTSMQVL